MTTPADAPLIGSKPQKFKTGLFGFNAERGITLCDAPGTLDLEWETTKRIAQIADTGGMDLILPFARWAGYGGRINANNVVYETFTWAAGLAAVTEQITIASTCHTPVFHPVAAAKAAMTVDHISAGRYAMNVVMGWFEPELAMFGLKPLEHDARYEYGDEWLSVIKRIWAGEEPFDHKGEYFDLTGVQGRPLPSRGARTPIINAGSSPAGMRFSAEHADVNFSSIFTIESGGEHAAEVKRVARDEFDRDIEVMTYGTVFCAPTEAEAKARHDSVIEHADWAGVENFMKFIGLNSESFGDQLRFVQERFALSGGGYHLVGTPEQVAAELVKISEAGIDGMIFGFVDWEQELPYFLEEVMPLLREAGIRT